VRFDPRIAVRSACALVAVMWIWDLARIFAAG
jgi:hypothetical protein